MLLAVDQVSNVSDVSKDGYTSHVRFSCRNCPDLQLCAEALLVQHRNAVLQFIPAIGLSGRHQCFYGPSCPHGTRSNNV
ncbi:hypothetical protein CFN58_29130 [Pseudomonas avellanae]|uniref:Uncharacterized protein n=2 Tax=Pseudomonas syringae group TaxID=136849 RepID=A0A261WCI8_9PSED|nr:hypothetical protein CT122_21010 [Pseudomonas syringae pv. actinidiae]MBL3831983.1 hypothetical protein [Pseudomonas syringae pv. theae]OZI83787.1 hypothetical protein CFN58_29130 [Pseudomonas avellanae]MBL3833844.1 hypothetical protein [Pseudomonas syringae pv. theae]MBL3866962.1 hypothetical protein [Pseudomonas syringae pv. theae]